MATLILDAWIEERLQSERAELGIDGHDEVWDGVYVVSPLADIEHQSLATRMSVAIQIAIGFTGQGIVLAGVNVSDRADDWKKNYRCPDVAVFLEDTRARNCDTFWYGGPDFAVEIDSPGDQSREKLGFYGKVGTRELLIVDRHPWALELYRLADSTLKLIGASRLPEGDVLSSAVIPFTFRLMPGEKRPHVEAFCTESGQTWTV